MVPASVAACITTTVVWPRSSTPPSPPTRPSVAAGAAPCTLSSACSRERRRGWRRGGGAGGGPGVQGANGSFGGGGGGGGADAMTTAAGGAGGFGGGGGGGGGHTIGSDGGLGGAGGYAGGQGGPAQYSGGGGGGGGAGLGGALFNMAGSVNIMSSTITGNSATGGPGGQGSSAAVAPARASAADCTTTRRLASGRSLRQTYGIAPITLSATDTSGLPMSFSVISGPATLSGSVLTVTGAGNVVVEASQAGNATYSAAVPVDESFTVAPASLTLTPTAGQSMVYGGTVPALTYTYTGLVNGDSSAMFSGGLVTTATSSSGVGGYPITEGTLAATGNYTIGTFNAGTLTVNAATLTVSANAQTKVYGSADPTLTYAVSGFQLSDTAATVLTGALTRTPSETVAGSPYAISQGTLAANTNYNITYNTAQFTITPAATTTTVASLVNPSVSGQEVSFTATVGNASGTGPVPAGSVQFVVDGTKLGTR